MTDIHLNYNSLYEMDRPLIPNPKVKAVAVLSDEYLIDLSSVNLFS